MATDWQRALVALSATVVTAAVLAAMYIGRSILIPVALAIFLAFVLAPVVARIQRRGTGRTVAVVVTVGLVIGTALGVGALVTYQVAQLADTLPDRREAIKAKVVSVKQFVSGGGTNRFGQLVDEIAEVVSPSRPQEKVVVESSSLSAQLNTYVSSAAEVLGQAAFTFILTVFMLLKREDLRNRMIRLLGDGRVTTTTKAVDDASRRISRYLLSQLLLNTAFGLVIVLGLLLLGVKYALLWGAIAMLMRYVPYIGTWIGLLPPTIFSIATAPEWGGGWGQPVAVLALFLGLEAFCNNVMEPKLYGKSMGLSEVAQLVAAGFWAFLWGPIGLILSGPLTVCLLVLGRHVARFNFLVVLLGDEPALMPRIAFYQRLAARDQDEAAEIALDTAKQTTPHAALDEVIVPALCMARRDAAVGDLDPADLKFAIRAAREIAEEVAETNAQAAFDPSKGHERQRLLICPARDEAEHVVAEILALTLDPNRWEVKIASDDTLASELITLVEEFRPGVVLIGTLAPGGLSHARYLIARLRRRFADLQVIVGRWGCEGETGDAREGELRDTDGIDRTLDATRKRLAEMHTLLPGREAATAREEREDLVGTGSA